MNIENSKPALHALADALLGREEQAIAQSIAFVLEESRGLWHNRARAMMCRRLKHCALSPMQARALTRCIEHRLLSGSFSEQFKDQLRLALHLDHAGVLAAARQAMSSAPPHATRYAAWVLAHAAQPTHAAWPAHAAQPAHASQPAHAEHAPHGREA